MNSRKKVLWKIFISTLYLSAFTFGGSRDLNPDHGILGQQGSDHTCRDEMESGADLCSLHDITPEGENESDLGDGAGGSDESWNIIDLKVDKR